MREAALGIYIYCFMCLALLSWEQALTPSIHMVSAGAAMFIHSFNQQQFIECYM